MISKTLDWIERVNKEFNIVPGVVLDVGSRENTDSKGTSTSPRQFFPDSNYLGVDVHAGHNVDRVLSVYDLAKTFQRNYFDAVLCIHVMEHLVNIWEAVDQMNFVLRKGGFFYVGVPGFGFPKHQGRSAGDAKDYWRPSEEAVREMIFKGYKILSFEHDKSRFGKHPIMHCLGVKK